MSDNQMINTNETTKKEVESRVHQRKRPDFVKKKTFDLTGQKNDCTFYADLAATDLNASMASIDQMDQPLIWINYAPRLAQDYSDMIPLIDKKVKAIISLGEQPGLVFDSCKTAIDLFLKADDLTEALYFAELFSQPKDVILFSPGAIYEGKNPVKWGEEFKWYLKILESKD